MRRCLMLYLLSAFLMGPGNICANESPAAPINAEDEKVIAVLEVLELMEMVNDIALFKDMEYIKEEDPDESQD